MNVSRYAKSSFGVSFSNQCLPGNIRFASRTLLNFAHRGYEDFPPSALIHTSREAAGLYRGRHL